MDCQLVVICFFMRRGTATSTVDEAVPVSRISTQVPIRSVKKLWYPYAAYDVCVVAQYKNDTVEYLHKNARNSSHTYVARCRSTVGKHLVAPDVGAARGGAIVCVRTAELCVTISRPGAELQYRIPW